MTIISQAFRVCEGDKVHLHKMPTEVDPLCKSKNAYQAMLAEHVSRLGALQQLLYS